MEVRPLTHVGVLEYVRKTPLPLFTSIPPGMMEEWVRAVSKTCISPGPFCVEKTYQSLQGMTKSRSLKERRMEKIDRSFETGDSNKVDIYIYIYVCVKLKYIYIYICT